MTNARWNYCGDMNLECGGYYWQEDGAYDYVLAVQVTPCSDCGGPVNLFWIEKGSIYLGDKARQDNSLSVIDLEPQEATRADYVQAALAYYGIERDTWNGMSVVQIGRDQAPQDSWQWGGTGSVDYQLRGNASLERFVRREFLGLSR